MFKNKILLYIAAIISVVIIIFAMTFIPQRLFRIDVGSVSKITIFNGSTGENIEITNDSNMEYIIKNLNSTTFKKRKLAYGYSGFSFKVIIYNEKGKVIEELLINSSSSIRYKGFFYKVTDNIVDYDYIENLFENS